MKSIQKIYVDAGSVALPWTDSVLGHIVIPVGEGDEFRFIAGSATKLLKACSAPCLSKSIEVKFAIPAQNCDSCGKCFNFRVTRLIPPDRRDDILSYDTLGQSVLYSAETLFLQNANVTLSDILDDVVTRFSRLDPARQGEDYIVEKIAADTLRFSVKPEYCFDFDVFMHIDCEGTIVSKTVVQEFADDQMSKQTLQAENDPWLFNVTPGDPLPKGYPTCDEYCRLQLFGCQSICASDNAGYSNHENSADGNYLAGALPYGIEFLVPATASGNQWQTALESVIGKVAEVSTPCNIAPATLDAAFTAATQNSNKEILISFSATAAVTALNSFGLLEVVNSAGQSLKINKKNATVTDGTYENRNASSVVTAIPAGTYKVTASVLVTLADGRVCQQKVTKSITI